MLYKIIVFLHVISVFGYLLSHGVSAGVAFALKKERDIQRIRALLDLSAVSDAQQGQVQRIVRCEHGSGGFHA